MTRRTGGSSRLADLFQGRDQTLDRVAQSAADLKPFVKAWRKVVPAPACDYVHPAHFGDGRLTVWVHSPVWANWVRHRQSMIIDRIHANQLPRVSSLKLQLVPEKRPGPSPDPPVPRAGPSRRTLEDIGRSARSIADPGIRESLERLVRSLEEK